MHRLIFLWAMLALPLSAKAVFHDRSFYPDPILELDLDGDSRPDVLLDVSRVSSDPDNPYYLATPLGAASIAAKKERTASFSDGDVVRLGKLDFKAAPHVLKTGGVYRDALGNFVSEGWGGATYDDLGNILFPGDGPRYQIDHFLVRLAHGVAWVDIDSMAFHGAGGRMDVRWAYLENPGDTITIKAMKPGREVELHAYFKTDGIFTVLAVNRSSLMVGADLKHGMLFYESEGKTRKLVNKKDYEMMINDGFVTAMPILWGHSRLKAVHDLEDFVTWPGGKTVDFDMKRGKFRYEVEIGDKRRRVGIHK